MRVGSDRCGIPCAARIPHPSCACFLFSRPHASASYELSDHIKGSITFTGVTASKPVLLVKLSIVRIEYADEEVKDAVVFDDAIMDARRWRARKLSRAGAAAWSAAGRAAEAGASASLKAESLEAWLPTEEDLSAAETDPDLPVSGGFRGSKRVKRLGTHPPLPAWRVK